MEEDCNPVLQGLQSKSTMMNSKTHPTTPRSFDERAMRWALGTKGLDLYRWFWYHTEFWIPKDERRPYTYLMRDFYHGSPLLTLLIFCTLSYCFGRWWVPLAIATLLKGLGLLLGGILLGHLFWGTPWKQGEKDDL